MRNGKSLVELAQEIERRAEAKKDYIADTRELVLSSNGKSELEVNGHGKLGVTEHAHGQIAQHLGIPKPYYDRLRAEVPALLDTNVNTLFREKPARRLVRTLDGNARALLSDRYRVIDNEDVAEAVLPVLYEAKEIRIVSSEITDRRLYVQAVFPRIEAEVVKGDVVQSGVIISNSEVGAGALTIEPLIYRLVCLNGLIGKDHSLRKHHVGSRLGGDGAAQEFYRDATLEADDRAFLLKVQDLVRASLEESKFRAIVARAAEAAGQKIEGDLTKVVEVTTKRLGFTQTEGSSILKNLIEGRDLSRWGLVNAVTALAHKAEDYDRSVELERAGGEILDLPTSEWKVISEAA